MDFSEIKTKIEGWEKIYQVEILRILSKLEKGKLNENRNGIFVNLSCIRPETKNALVVYIKYVDNLMLQLQSTEATKNIIKTTLFGQFLDAPDLIPR
jgi:hypothetical protein